MLMFDSVNLMAVLVAAVASFFVGSLWYSPLLFGDIWMKLAGIKKAKNKPNNMWLRFFLYFVGMFVMSFVLAQMLLFTASSTVVEGLLISFWLWLGFIAPITLGGVLWENKPIMLFVLNNAYNLVSLGILSTIIVLWK